LDYKLRDHLYTFLTKNRQELFKKVLAERTRHFTVATEDVFQMHNTSAVMRTCDVFGIQDLNVVEEQLGKRVDSEIAMGAQKWVDFNRFSSVKTCMADLKDKGYRIIATTPHKDATYLDDFDVTQKAAFFFGKERDGLSDYVLDNADGFLKIPMYGFTESLNISVSAAIILQSSVTRLKTTNIDWRLSEEEKFGIEMNWLQKTIKSSSDIITRFRLQNQ